jgi:hypothetical protein
MGKKNKGKSKNKKQPAWKRYVKDPDNKSWKKKSDYKDSKKRWNNSARAQRNPRGLQEFKIREAAYKDSRAAAKSGGNNKGNNNSSSQPAKYDRSSGEFKDIKGALGEDIQAGNDAAQSLQNQEVPMGNDQPVGIGGWPSSLDDLFIKQQKEFDLEMIEVQDKFNATVGSLQGELSDAKDSYAQANQFMTQQVEAANAARRAAEQRAYNMRNAFVPQANPTALSVSYGDQRRTTRRAENNQLSDLTILSGLGTTANPLAGLQLA